MPGATHTSSTSTSATGATPVRDCHLPTPPSSTATPPNSPAQRRERPGMLHSSPLLPARFSGEAPPPPRHCRRNHDEHLFSLVFPANVFLSRNVRWPGGQRSHTHTHVHEHASSFPSLTSRAQPSVTCSQSARVGFVDNTFSPTSQ